MPQPVCGGRGQLELLFFHCVGSRAQTWGTGCWDPNLGPLKEQYAHLFTRAFLQPYKPYFKVVSKVVVKNSKGGPSTHIE